MPLPAPKVLDSGNIIISGTPGTNYAAKPAGTLTLNSSSSLPQASPNGPTSRPSPPRTNASPVPHLHTSAAAKATRYHTFPGRFFPRQSPVCAVHPSTMHTTTGFPQRRSASYTGSPPPRLAKRRLQRQGPGTLEAASALMHDAICSSWRMHAACGRMP